MLQAFYENRTLVFRGGEDFSQFSKVIGDRERNLIRRMELFVSINVDPKRTLGGDQAMRRTPRKPPSCTEVEEKLGKRNQEWNEACKKSSEMRNLKTWKINVRDDVGAAREPRRYSLAARLQASLEVLCPFDERQVPEGGDFVICPPSAAEEAYIQKVKHTLQDRANPFRIL